MADIYGSHFEFGGTSSKQFGLIIASVRIGRYTKLSGAKEGITVFSKSAKKRYLIGDDYSSSHLSFDVEIISDSDKCLSKSERRQIEKWLFGGSRYQRLYFDMDDDTEQETYEYIDGERKRLYLNCRFVNPEKLEYNSGIVGYKATLEADSNMFWQDAITKSYAINNEDAGSVTNISVEIDTDMDEYIYPAITIHVGESGGDILIFNNNDDSARITKFTGLSPNTTVVMKGDLNYVSGQNYEKFVGKNFVRLLDGENILTISGNVSLLEIKYSARRYL